MSSFFEFHEQMRRKPGSAGGSTPATGAAPAPGAAKSGGAAPPLTVSQLTARIDSAIRAGLPGVVHVRGEISNFKPNAASGHLYFTLKDQNNCIDCVMWKSDAERLKFKPSAGIEMLAFGMVKVYGKTGRYQLYVSSLSPLGQGALELAFKQLRSRLEAEGLFESERKKPLPPYPRTVVIVSAPNSAAMQDMLKVLRPIRPIRLLICPVPVQGDGAAPRIAAAIAHVNAHRDRLGADLMILGRGGGSLEDLWAFNEEVVARAIAASAVPIVTGIGHEVDTSIADLVADYHAHTPTEAARVVCGQWPVASHSLDGLNDRLHRGARNLLAEARQRLRAIERHATFRRPRDRIDGLRQLLDERDRGLMSAIQQRLHESQWRVGELRRRLEKYMPAVLSRVGQRVRAAAEKLTAAMAARLRCWRDRVALAESTLADRHPKHRLPLEDQRLAHLDDRLNRAMKAQLMARRQALDAVEKQMTALGPENVLRRGYTMTMRKKDGSLIRSARDVKPGDRLVTRFVDGTAESRAADPNQPGLFD